MHGLLGRATLSIHRSTGHLVTEPCSQPTGTRNIPRQGANGVDAAKDDIVVLIIGNTIALHQGSEHSSTQICAVDLR